MGLLGDIADFGKGVIENNLKWTERAAKVGEFIVRNTVGAELAQVAKFGGQTVDLSQKAADFLASQIGRRLIRAARSPILVAGQQTIESMKHSTGAGDPENGQRFGEGADKMGAVGQVLVSAFPDDSWDSSGASAYAGRNSEQVGRVQTMLGLDHMVAGVLSTEAGQIAATRDSLDGHSDWLGAMSLLTTSAGIVPGFGTAAQMAAEFAMVAKAVCDSNSDLRTLCDHIDENAAVLHTAAVQYEALAGGATPTGAEFEPPAGDPQVPTAPGDPGATDPGGPTGGDVRSGDDAAPGGGVRSGGGAGVPSTGGGGGTPSGSPSAPSMPTGMSGTGSPSSDAAANAAGALGGILGSLVSPLSGMLGGITQAAGQAAQAATQAGTQAAQMASQAAGQAGGPAADQLDKASGGTGVDAGDPDGRDDEDRDGRDEDAEDDEKDEHDKDREKDGEDQVGEPEEGAAGGLPATDSAGGPADPLGAGAEDEVAKTLPPDLEAMAAGGAAAGPAPVHVGADFEQGQLHMAAAATLDRGVPGSAAVIDR
ncbi:EspA/EspE family type VII secretion system effector [Mycolicibacterium lutetiense]